MHERKRYDSNKNWNPTVNNIEEYDFTRRLWSKIILKLLKISETITKPRCKAMTDQNSQVYCGIFRFFVKIIVD